MSSNHTSKKISILSIAFLVLVASFAYGVVVGTKEVWPYSLIRQMDTVVDSLLEHGTIVPDNFLMRAAADAPREYFKSFQPENILSGYYAFLVWDETAQSYGVWLYDSEGQKQHTWIIDYETLDADGPLNGSDSPHAFKMLEDGSFLVSFDKGDVMARIDTCSKPVWTKPGVYHHSLERAEDGSFWTWRGDGTAYGHYQYLENFDPENGKTLQEISLIDDIIMKMGPQSAIFGLRPDYGFEHLNRTPNNRQKYDLFHPNDIDILSSQLADKFSGFQAGDLMISLRTINLIAVINPNSKKVVWWSHGPWRQQHDPDFTADGKISVFDNNTNRARSEIIKIDPVTRDIENALFNGNLRFYSSAMGKHQYLPNGNVLIVSPGEGRVLEVSATGDKIMEFNNVSQISADYNARINNAVWLPADYFANSPECNN